MVEHLVRKINRASPLDIVHVRRNVLKLRKKVLADIDTILKAFPPPKIRKNKRRAKR